MIGSAHPGAVDPADVGLVHHHGAELVPVVELIVGGALPVAAAVWLGRLRSASARLTGGPGRRPVEQPIESLEPVRLRPDRLPAGHHPGGPPPIL